MSFFNKDHYPTPPEIINYMISEDNLEGKVILEPSAGSGNIVDHIKALGAEVIACELSPDLAKIVQSKCKFLKPNFLEVEAHEVSHIHGIYMNPPFSADEKHILHAWAIAPSGCHIVALCNWQTLENDYTGSRRRLLNVIRDYGNKQNLNNAFSDSERKTNVEIGLIHLYKPKSDNDFSDYFESEEDAPEENVTGIMPYNSVREVVQRYVNACKLYDEVIENGIKMNALAGIFGVKDISFTCNEGDKQTSKTDFQKELQKKAWNWIFNKLDMNKYMTASLKEDINKFVEQQIKIPFTMKNIYKMIELVVATHGQRMDKAIIEIFDKLTTHYHDNRYAVEGWKTNSHYLVNKKFILEGVAGCEYGGGVGIHWNSRSTNLLDDLYKALCYLTGTPYKEAINLYTFSHTQYETIDGIKTEKREKFQFGKWYDWGFFEIKCFKKGTAHLKFKDENTWALFNRRVAEIKGFPLPESLKKAA